MQKFERPHHQRISKVLQALNGPLLKEHECYFAGGTAIALRAIIKSNYLKQLPQPSYFLDQSVI
jgi:hypothetical protein